MSTVDCPYCDEEQDVEYDGGYGYAQDVAHQTTCRSCEKTFVFSSEIYLEHVARKADCLNRGDHSWAQIITWPRQFTRWRCKACDEGKNLTDAEMLELLTKENK